ncbi:DUF4317 family protein [Butyricicoccus sp. OM06-6AC]|nr:DUF4317 family protein [Butyricicoccus sp. OM06-6AC]
MQKTISAMVAEREEDESLPPVELTAEAVSGLATEAEVPDEVRAQIEKSYEQVFGDQPPQAHNVLDSRLVEEGTVKAHTAALEQKVAVLQQELAHQAANAADTDEDDVPWETGTVIDVRMPQERAVNVHTEVVEGQKCLSFRSLGMNPRGSTAWKWNNLYIRVYRKVCPFPFSAPAEREN